MVGLVPAERELAGIGVVDVGGAVAHVHERAVGLARVVDVVRDGAGANHTAGRTGVLVDQAEYEAAGRGGRDDSGDDVVPCVGLGPGGLGELVERRGRGAGDVPGHDDDSGVVGHVEGDGQVTAGARFGGVRYMRAVRAFPATFVQILPLLSL